jgi:hypothetical protein
LTGASADPSRALEHRPRLSGAIARRRTPNNESTSSMRTLLFGAVVDFPQAGRYLRWSDHLSVRAAMSPMTFAKS